MTVAELLERMTASELTEWAAFAQLEPFGGAVDDMRAGLAASSIINVNLPEKAERIAPLDFYPWHAKKAAEVEPPVESPEVLAMRIKAEIFGVKPQ